MITEKNGIYYWKGTFDKEYERKIYKLLIWIMGGICLILIALGAVMFRSENDIGMLMAFAIPGFVAFAVTLLVCLLFDRFGGGVRGYMMTNEMIQMGYGRSAGMFIFSSARHVILTKTYIEPKMGIGGFRIYVPEEDMPFVKQYVLSRLPLTCEVEDQSYFV